jgi:hypothetical protein
MSCSCAPRELSVEVNFARTYYETNDLANNVGIADSLCKFEELTVTDTKLSAQVSGEETVCDIFPNYKRCNVRKMLANVGDEKKSDGGNIRRQLQDDNFEKITSIEVLPFGATLEFTGAQVYEVELRDRDSFDVSITDVTDPCIQETRDLGSLLSITGVLQSGAQATTSTLIEWGQDCGVDEVLDISKKDNEACGTEFVSNIHSESICSVPHLLFIFHSNNVFFNSLFSLPSTTTNFLCAFTTLETGNSNSSTKFQEFESSESFKSTKGFQHQHRLQQACKQQWVQLHLCRSYCWYHVSSCCCIARCCSKEHEEVVSTTS